MHRFCFITALTLLASSASAQNQSEDARRLAVVKEYTTAAKFVADKTQEYGAQYLYTNIVSLLHPLRMSSGKLEKIPTSGVPLNNMPIAVMALLRNDYQKKDLPPLFKQHLEPNAKIGGGFTEVVLMITLIENDNSSLVKGMTLLHEAAHAANFLEKKAPPRKEGDPPDVIEETQVHIFEEKLWRLIGGQVYENLIVKEVARLRAEFKKQGFPGFKGLQTKERSKGFNVTFFAYPELRTLVVPSNGEHDMQARQGALVQSALFRMIDEEVPNVNHQADLTKATVMNYLHKLAGVYQ
jgi:hypothetical protein